MYQKILKFWFEELDPKQWWVKDDQLDEIIRIRFSEIHEQAKRCELFEWRATAEGRLAEILVLDQFSRNLHRDSPLCFANDALALALAQEAVSIGADMALTAVQRNVLYLPFMHSESLIIHKVAMHLYQSNGIQSSFDFEIKHQQIIRKFGRYPHRNKVLGRQSTEQEIDFLQQPGSGF
ncbi:hypothetical protein AU255_16830 [Methyloprofundus sedimenti]|uniref:DUF924 domain-containing protein n=1 Tax=Methyloprofundus sedimenti TaxID=1420851 RepID=A0A1V8M391_9GAMM|nr:DUF924 family protein [Methyloprofundus sedimenti]OQK15978.1 hypothetical protein AU255_16830 [Methyloprofundus sedimenti]